MQYANSENPDQQVYLQSDMSFLCLLIYEPAHDKIYKKTCAASEDSDQSVHLSSLISLH